MPTRAEIQAHFDKAIEEGYDSSDIQVLAPMKAGPCGIGSVRR